MELEELKKSWNALDEHLKDKELIKEDELERLIGHADKGIHAIARLNIKLILISLPVLVLFLLEVAIILCIRILFLARMKILLSALLM